MSGFAKTTRILMADSTTKEISKLKPGDNIFASNSEILTVDSVTKKTNKMYDVIPIKGTKFTITEDTYLMLKVSNYEMVYWEKSRQRWKIRWIQNFSIKEKTFHISNYASKKFSSKTSPTKSSTKNSSKELAQKAAKAYLKNNVPNIEGYTPYCTIVKIKVKHFAKLSKAVQAVYKLYCVGLKFTDKHLDLDPYILGYWLGDGTTSCHQITAAEPEIVEIFDTFAKNIGLSIKKLGDYRYNITGGMSNIKKGSNPFINFMRNCGVFNHKHIPLDYKFNSRENRLKLLAGLVDSDGHNDKNGFDFVFKSEKLADDVIFLAKSLGFQAFKSPCKKTCTNSPRGRVTGIYYRTEKKYVNI